MLKLRPYKKSDAKVIVSWCKDEKSFRNWTADRYESFPITDKDMNFKYFDCNGDCTEEDNFYPMTAFDENGIVGHFILRYVGGNPQILRVGFVIVDDTKRSQGYGKEMMKLTLEYAVRVAGAEKVTLGVFENNKSAYYCYKSVGFKDVDTSEENICELFGEKWKILELEMTRDKYFE